MMVKGNPDDSSAPVRVTSQDSSQSAGPRGISSKWQMSTILLTLKVVEKPRAKSLELN